jgi:hypothetical protein
MQTSQGSEGDEREAPSRPNGLNQRIERHRVSSCNHDVMDELRELAVRAALFEHLDDLLLASDDDTLEWNQTESFQFNGEIFSIRQARGRGISPDRSREVRK